MDMQECVTNTQQQRAPQLLLFVTISLRICKLIHLQLYPVTGIQLEYNGVIHVALVPKWREDWEGTSPSPLPLQMVFYCLRMHN